MRTRAFDESSQSGWYILYQIRDYLFLLLYKLNFKMLYKDLNPYLLNKPSQDRYLWWKRLRDLDLKTNTIN